MVVMISPLLNDNLRIFSIQKPFPAEAFVSELSVEAFHIGILPR